MKAIRHATIVWMLLLAMSAVGCSTISTGPVHEIRFDKSMHAPILRLAEVTEKLTGTWADDDGVVGFRESLLLALEQTEGSALFSNDPEALSTQIDLVSDHESDGPRLAALGTKSIVTLGLAPLRYYSEWNISCDVTLRTKEGKVVAKYPLRETGVYEIQTQGLSMFSLFGAALGGDGAYNEIQKKTARNLAVKLFEAVANDYERLSGVYRSKPLKTKGQPERAMPPITGKSWAVIIGISEYKYSNEGGLSSLIFADDDAMAFARVLYHLGWNKSHIKYLTNEKATKRNIEIALESWLSKAGQDDQVILFWAGHGFSDPENHEKVYFATYDTDITIPSTGYRMDRVRAALKEVGSKNVILFADTCHAGKLITRGDASRGISIVPGIKKMVTVHRVQIATEWYTVSKRASRIRAAKNLG